jgi:hypothetical protein
MFAGLINQAKGAVTNLVLRYVARASVAVPFIIAAGFALAALAVMLVERFGHATGYWLMAGGLMAIGVIAGIAVSVKEHGEEVAEQQAEQTDTKETFSEATSQAMAQAPLALAGALLTTPSGATGALQVAKVLGRNFPLVVFLAMIGALFWPTSQTETSLAEEKASEPQPHPNGPAPAQTYHYPET